MSNESVEVLVARLEERLKAVHGDLMDAKGLRAVEHAAFEALARTMTSVDKRLENVEAQMAVAKPTIEEFITIKHKVVGAGVLGKWVWAGLAGLIGLIAGSREAIINFLVRGSS